jgi:hypothetical protein
MRRRKDETLMAVSQLARTDLEALLRKRQLDGALTSAHPLPDKTAMAPTGLAALDARLGGGWPRGQVSEIVGPACSGRWRVALSSLTAATRRGELVALVDTLDVFDPGPAAALGPHWPYWLWVRGSALGARGGGRLGGRAQHTVLAEALDRAVKATALVLSAGGFGLVVLDLAELPRAVVRGVPFTTWLRLQRMVAGQEAACVIVGADPLARGPRGLTVSLSAAPQGRWRGQGPRARLLCGLGTRACVVRAQRGPEGERDVLIDVPVAEAG